MSKYFTAWDNFAVDTIGTAIAGWTARGSATPTRPPAYGTSVPFKRRYLAFTPSSSADHACVTWDTIDADADRDDFDILTLVVLPHATSTVHNIYARGAGSAPATDYYRAKALYSGGNLTISIEERVASASVSSLASTALGAWGATTSFWFRFRGIGTSLSATAWAVGTTEPTTPTVSVTDGSLTAAGWCGLGGVGSGLVSAFNFFAIGTNGDVAVRPRSNTEYTAWLASQEAIRVITARMAFTGYDSSGSPYTATRYAYVSNHGYTSHAQDTPASQHFDNFISAVPTFSREMPAALSGQAVVNFGEMRLRNPAREIDGAAYLLLDGTTNCCASTPDSAVASITGDLDLRIRCSLDDWTPGARNQLISKWTSAGNASWIWRVNTDGKLALLVSVDGTATTVNAPSTVASSITDGAIKWVRVTFDCDNGAGGNDTKFYTSEDGVTWTQLGATVTTAGATSIFNGNAAVQIGYNTSSGEPMTGKVYRAQVYSGIAGTLAVDFNLANVIKGATSFSTPTGEVWTVNGTAKIRQAAGTTPGQLDDWLRVHWIRDGFEMQMGAPDWPLHDFRHIVRGRLGLPTAPRPDEMVFRIADMSDAFAQDIQSDVFASGEYIGQKLPIYLGQISRDDHGGGQIEPPQTDAANLIYTLCDVATGVWYTSVASFLKCYDNQVELWTPALTCSAVAGNVITMSAPHGMVVNYLWRSPSAGALPTPLANSTDYWVQSVPTTSSFTLSATRGGAVITLTSATLVANTSVGYGYTVTNTGPTTLQLAATPAGRITVLGILLEQTVAEMYLDVAARVGLSANFLTEGTGFPNDAGYWVDTQKRSALDVLGAIAAGTMTWFGFTADGLMQAGLIDLPASTAVATFDRTNVKNNSLRLVDTIRQVDFSKAQISKSPWFLTGGPFQTGSQAALQGRTVLAPITYGATAAPLDDYPAVSDANGNFVFENLYTDTSAIWVGYRDFFKQRLGVYEFDTTLPAAELNIGDTITLDFPRLGWKTYSSADPASPDNTATIDATKAVVIGLNINYSAPGPFKVRVKCFRRQPGYYPTANLN